MSSAESLSSQHGFTIIATGHVRLVSVKSWMSTRAATRKKTGAAKRTEAYTLPVSMPDGNPRHNPPITTSFG